MTVQQSARLSVLALVANLVVAGSTLVYVRETEHRLTKLEILLHEHDCRFNPKYCKEESIP